MRRMSNYPSHAPPPHAGCSPACQLHPALSPCRHAKYRDDKGNKSKKNKSIQQNKGDEAKVIRNRELTNHKNSAGTKIDYLLQCLANSLQVHSSDSHLRPSWP